ncbi:ribulose-phosphate 3-epimerase [Mycoplasmopsis californica]|uniref:Ribulose phosphate epimerase n=1 Tax=Mycoplasmopsis equigenitalium TaxID=114883 RepID=A0ABY5J2D6_9BACT|nr:ribulose phosphate epimerase [Mycoplasmopsis equigenitalium]UUD36933.1 ribulose phosphate epimerase [Mycoplasmopsis equigenitalium]VEU69772.1 ribulose-phosphate 3-epimerase [Mycoplasmopsis californica]
MQYSQSICALNSFESLSDIDYLYQNGFDNFHLDFIDFHYVKSFGLKLDDVLWLRKRYTKATFEAHCMCVYSHPLISTLVGAGINKISLPAKEFNLKYLLENKKLFPNTKFGIMIEAKDDVQELSELIKKCDYVVLMTIDIIGGVGQKLNPTLLEKVPQIRKIKKNIEIISDGGLRQENVFEFLKAGVDIAVGGSILHNFPTKFKTFKEFWKEVE